MSDTLNDQSLDMLKQAGLYKTQARVAVLKVLLQAAKPMSQVQIAAALPEPTDKVTIYRTLTALMEADLLHRAYIDERATFYELAHHCSKSQCHPHFTCTACGTTYCFKDLRLPMVLTGYKGFTIRRQKVRLEGICPGCG